MTDSYKSRLDPASRAVAEKTKTPAMALAVAPLETPALLLSDDFPVGVSV